MVMNASARRTVLLPGVVAVWVQAGGRPSPCANPQNDRTTLEKNNYLIVYENRRSISTSEALDARKIKNK